MRVTVRFAGEHQTARDERQLATGAENCCIATVIGTMPGASNSDS